MGEKLIIAYTSRNWSEIKIKMGGTSRPSDPVAFKIFAGEQFRSFSPGNNRKSVIKWNLIMTGDAEFVPGDPRWHNFLLGISPLGFIFTGVEASGALSRDVPKHLHIAFSITRQTKIDLMFLFLVLLLRIINMTRANYALTMFIREKSKVSYRDRRYEFMRV